MKKIVQMLALLVVSVSLFFTLSCSDSATSTKSNDINAANALALQAFSMLNSEIILAEFNLNNPQSGNDVFPEATYNEIKSRFQSAIDYDYDNPMAHLGMSTLELASINYDQEVWDLINDLSNNNSNKRIFNNQLSFLASIPQLNFQLMSSKSLRDGDVFTIAKLQDLVNDNVISKIDNAISHLDDATNLADDTPIMINTGEELLELDKGEIYAFRATLNLVAAAFRMMTVYDVDLLDENNSWNWTDDIQNQEYETYNVEIIDGNKYLYIDYCYTENMDMTTAKILKRNMTERESFLKFRNNNSLKAKNNLQGFVEDIQSAVDAIGNENDNQENDIIKQNYIAQINQDIAEYNSDEPEFMASWHSIDDAIAWVDNLLNEPYTFNFDEKSLKVDLGRMFDPGVEDMKDYLPYHEWLPENQWETQEIDSYYGYYNYGNDYTYWDEDGNEVVIEDVYYIEYRDVITTVQPMKLTDANGNDIGEDEVLFLPDYTFNGIFPDMNRVKFIEMFE
ncbi:MAG: hypothetical protein JXR48_11745 [Candidatus Delongbacteria bacterium]|nr:hypothetical protein [Candidatus Delongbacteria bacterium]MBN2835624.1 hypothetical protein [Candidatus Delongbacteria bacterium]